MFVTAGTSCKAQLQGAFGRSHGVQERGNSWDALLRNDLKVGTDWALCIGNRFGISDWSHIEAVFAVNRPRSKLGIFGFIQPTSPLASRSLGFSSSATVRPDLSVGLFSAVRWYSREDIREEIDIGFNIGLSVSDDLNVCLYNRGIWNQVGFIRGWSLLQLNYSVSKLVILNLAQLINSMHGRTIMALQIEKDAWNYALSIRTRPFCSGFTIGRAIKGLNVSAGLSYQLLPGASPNFELNQG